MPSVQRCPSCFSEVSASAFQCPKCERLLTDEFVELQARPPTPYSLVRSLIEQPVAEPKDEERPAPPGLQADAGARSTARMRIPPAWSLIPKVTASLRMTELNLTPFEAWVVSMMDGHSSGQLLASALDLSELEMRILMQTLADRKVIALSQPASVPSAPARPRVLQEPEVDEMARNALQTAINIERTGNLVEAARFLEIAIATSPDAAPLYNRLALIMVRTANLAEAERLLNKALELAPGNEVYAHNLSAVRRGRSARK